MATLTFLTTTLFDHGVCRQLVDVLQSHGISRPLLCTDRGLVAAGIVEQIETVISNSVQSVRYDETPENPTEEAVLAAAERYRSEGCDGLIAVGGGSSIDLAKAVALRVTHDGDLLQYTAGQGGVERIGPVAPLIAVPTTAGTGSEVSSGSVVIMNNGEKLIFISRHLVPRTAVCDPELTFGLPPLLTAATGMDAMTHCIEAVLSPQVNPPAEAVGLDGLRRGLGHGHLLAAVKDGQDPDARWNMMMASTEGAMAFSKGLGAVHSMSHACGALPGLRLHHGTLNAVFLPTVLRFNADHVGDKYARIREAACLDAKVDLADYIEQLNSSLGLPPNLAAMGVTADQIPGLAQHAARDVCTFTNPRPASVDDYQRLIAAAMG
ncbi:MAG: iron-containing alcohol dehydrogenase [Gammaproteobacteria bacterium]|nr:iron-containing alcohol dehydrogenase [Gammaproteobacteria bacterium]